MRVGISLLTLVPGVVGGSETYARELVRALGRVGELDYRVFKPSIAEDGIPGRTVRSYRARHSMRGRVIAMTHAAVAPRRLRRELDLTQLDAIHFPLTVMLPRVEHPPAAVSLLDIQHLLYPEFFSRAELAYRRVVYGWSLRRARKIIAISRHVKETLVERLGIPPERIDVVHLGLDHALFHPNGADRQPFLLYPANPWPHKNHQRLFEAFVRVRSARPELRLVLTGTGLERLGRVPDGVEVRGRVTRDELADLYRRASALVFPSLYEGFGQPPLEAMASGTPVAVSTAGALPEICGDAAIYFDPTSVDEIAEAIVAVLERSDHVVARGLERASRFTWEATARRHDEVYRALVAA